MKEKESKKVKGPRYLPEDQRRKEILNAARRAFEKKGFHNAKIEDIAKQAGIAHGTVYLHFPNKAAIAEEIIADTGASGFLENFRNDSPLDAPEKLLKAVAKHYYGNLEERIPLIRFNVSQSIFDPVVGRKYNAPHRLINDLESFVKQYQEMGIFKKGNPLVYGHIFYGIMFGFLYAQELLLGKEKTQLDINKLIPQFVDVFLHGIEEPRSKPNSAKKKS